LARVETPAQNGEFTGQIFCIFGRNAPASRPIVEAAFPAENYPDGDRALS
jgi:hypothetical protein